MLGSRCSFKNTTINIMVIKVHVRRKMKGEGGSKNNGEGREEKRQKGGKKIRKKIKGKETLK